MAEFFLDLHRLEGRPEDLAFAVTLIDDLLGRAISDRDGMRWSNYEYRKPEPDLPLETSYLQGAPGIGSTLLLCSPARRRAAFEAPPSLLARSSLVSPGSAAALWLAGTDSSAQPGSDAKLGT